jgi:hypothetical protein
LTGRRVKWTTVGLRCWLGPKVDREPDGRQRVARATQSDYNSRHWDLEVEHPSGEKFVGTFTGGSADDVCVALTQMLMDNENAFRDDKERGDRRRAEPIDRNRAVRDDGTFSAPQIVPRR